MTNFPSEQFLAYHDALAEPDLTVTRGSGRRWQPITNGIGDHQRGKAEYIAKYGQEAWNQRCKEYEDYKKHNYDI